MRDIGEALRALEDDYRDEATADVPPTAVGREIARRRRGRASLWAGGIAACTGLVLAAAVPTIVDAVRPPPSPVPDAMPTAVPQLYEEATVAFTDATWSENPLATGPPQCGHALPDQLSARDGLSATHDVPDAVRIDGVGYLTGVAASVTVRYGRFDELPAVMGPLVGLVAADGVVVGWLPPTSSRGLSVFAGAQPFTLTWNGLGGTPVACRDAAGDALERLGPGEYEVAWASQVVASEDDNARADLALRGWAIPPAELVIAYREGSYECGRALAWTGTRPLTCDPGAVPGTRIDLESGTVTFPYDPGALGREIDVTFVSPAVPLTIDGGPADPLAIIERENPPHVAGEPMQCGAEYGGLASSDLLLQLGMPFEQLEFGQPATVDAWARGIAWTEATVDLQTDARLWITQPVQRRAALNDGGSYAYVLHRVVGSASITVPEQFVIDRYSGPLSVEMVIGEVEWCDGPPEVSAATLTYSLHTPHTVTTGAGSVDFEVARLG
ncbi:hypothetical protein [uncultured Demequina sp.]|uniref:hypothetical protein n=1 Tax=uncultured Demequina sp. TaxID=693499 RepID=UPI0025FB6744|nr:hypothetical protein [uncultured Demequina sp.]